MTRSVEPGSKVFGGESSIVPDPDSFGKRCLRCFFFYIIADDAYKFNFKRSCTLDVVN